MAEATHICTHCGYEGKPVRPPRDDAGENGKNEGSAAIARVANLIIPGLGLIIKPLAMVLMLPIYIVLWPIKRKLASAKHCSNCGLPLMVPMTSDAGWLAKRKNDIKAGLVVIDADKPKPVLAFGKEVVLPGDEIKPEVPQAPRLTSLPHLDKLLEEEKPVEDAAEPAPAPEVKKKPVDPEQW